MKSAAIYARVSSDKQKEENTVASQTATLLEFARDHGYSVPDAWIFEDEGYSGASLVRPGLERVRDLAAEGQLHAILVYAPDRLSRQIRVPDPPGRGVRPPRCRDRLYQGAAERDAGRSAAAAIPGHDRRIRTGANPRTITPG